MPENNDRINLLLEQYINKTISESDFNELFDYISKDENRHIFDDFMKKVDKISLPDADVHHIDWQQMYDNIVAGKKEKSRFAILVTIGKTITIAASLIMTMYLGYKFFNKQPVDYAVQTTAKQDLVPGSNKAILKLADGSEIILNNAQNGVLTQQGHSKVSKSNDGLIEYNEQTANGEETVYVNTLSTPRGGQYKLMLPDKSLVWLNAQSSITFPSAFTGKQRKVSVTGEAYFEVTKDKTKPFMVETGSSSVEVLGTHFNVNVYPNEENAAITLLEGSIKLNHNNSSKLLLPGQQAIYNAHSSGIELKRVDLDNVVDWKNGLFIFEDASVAEVMRQIERWYNVDVKYIGKTPDIKFNGVISRNNNVSKLLKLLQAAGNIDFKINEKTIEVKQINK
ncbi:FecR family protein [Pedobacter endophyticus]|uniref:FecR domain-containing protein n=1 Tax=Pedobacter endophyticus TaxID=2789740 RepID=A0A7S9L105_9SPHI|nr:FecR family protein [Pedobacter endophyticus]QPH40501.1 FecR domain-containing protein [Pedobacter endophyticus]